MVIKLDVFKRDWLQLRSILNHHGSEVPSTTAFQSEPRKWADDMRINNLDGINYPREPLWSPHFQRICCQGPSLSAFVISQVLLRVLTLSPPPHPSSLCISLSMHKRVSCLVSKTKLHLWSRESPTWTSRGAVKIIHALYFLGGGGVGRRCLNLGSERRRRDWQNAHEGFSLAPS